MKPFKFITYAIIGLMTTASAEVTGIPDDFAAHVEKSVQTGKETIFTAAESGNVEYIQSYLRDGGSVDRRQLYGGSMLYYAVRGGADSIVEILLGEGADPSIPNSADGLTPLLLSEQMTKETTGAKSRMPESILKAAQARADFAQQVESLADSGDIENLMTILQSRTYRYVSKDMYKKILNLAFANESVPLIEFMLHRVPDGLLIESIRETLAKDSRLGGVELEKAQAILAREAKRRQYIELKYKILEGFIGTDVKESPVYSHIDSPVFGGRTLLIHAIQQDNLSLVELLLQSGASPVGKDAKGVTPMQHLEQQERDLEVESQMKKLLEQYGKLRE